MMKRWRWNRGWIVFGTVAALCIPFALWGEEPLAKPTNSARADSETPGQESAVGDVQPLSVAIARDRAKVMHALYAATLDVMHERYFHGQRAVVPARALEDVFAEIKRQSNVEARWISVNMEPMSISHKPQNAFEKKAAEELAAGKGSYEAVADGFYRRAGAIPMTGGCISCHEGLFKTRTSKPLFTGLVITVPLGGESAEPQTSNK